MKHTERVRLCMQRLEVRGKLHMEKLSMVNPTRCSHNPALVLVCCSVDNYMFIHLRTNTTVPTHLSVASWRDLWQPIKNVVTYT